MVFVYLFFICEFVANLVVQFENYYLYSMQYLCESLCLLCVKSVLSVFVSGAFVYSLFIRAFVAELE